MLRRLGLAGEELLGQHSQLRRVREAKPDAWVFGFSREPYSFLRSYFLHRCRGGWHESRDLDLGCEASSLPAFLDLYLEKFPGWVGRWYDLYLDGAEFVGKVESLRPDLCRVLDQLDFEYDRRRVMSDGPKNVTPTFGPDVLGTREEEERYRRLVRVAEAVAYEKWGY